MDSTKPKDAGLSSPIKVEIPASAWEPTGPKIDGPSSPNGRSRLLCTMTINGQYFHAEAYQVQRKNGEQVIADPQFSPEWEGISALTNHDGGPFTTQRIGRREYVIVIAPYLN